MNTYIERAKELSNEFSLEKESKFSSSPLEVKLLSFNSSVGVDEDSLKAHSTLSPFTKASDNIIEENIHFKYPILKLKGEEKSKGVIILLHGLNERTWDKYLPWAERLALDTGKLVLLFPISFHMNRTPKTWNNPRAMMPYVDERKSRLGNLKTLSFLNVALSNRLTDSPFRFYASGKQTAIDLCNLVQQIREGKLPYIHSDATVDLFAYSIGGLISQVLLMSNPQNLFSNMKLFMFCSGSVFLEMNGNSKSIMDAKAFDTLKHYYESEFIATKDDNSLIQKMNQAFTNMISLKNKEQREDFFQKVKNRMQIVALKKDTVISSLAIQKSLGADFIKHSFTELDFPFYYTHENPFPTNKSSLNDLINPAFDAVFSRASTYLA